MALNLKSSILIVDDMDQVVISLTQMLSEIGYENICSASDGNEGLNSIINSFKEEKPFDLVFLDINLPGINGLKILESLRKESEYKELKIIILTTSNEKENIISAVNGGANNYLLKPFDLKALESKLNQL